MPSPDVLALTGSTQFTRWNVAGPVGTSVVVTYSFSTSQASYDQARPGFSGFSAAQQVYARQALATWSDVSGISFVEVPEAVGGQIRLGLYDMTGVLNSVGQQASGFAYYPQYSSSTVGGVTTYSPYFNGIGGDVFLNANFYAGNDASMAPGQRGYSILLHELGHAIGFKHPFEGTPTIDPTHDNGSYTVLSYNRANSTTTLGTVDIEASQYYYGGQDLVTTWNSVTLTVTRTGTAASEWVLGTELTDFLNGREGNDTLRGELGSDSLDGGAGADTLTGGASADRFVFDAVALTDAQSAIVDHVTDYHFTEGDRIDLSALLSAPYNHGSGQPVGALVRAVEDVTGSFANLQVDPDGAANGANFVTIARLDGIQPGVTLNVVLDSAAPAGSSLSVAAAPQLAVHDFNGDHMSDIVWRNDAGSLAIWDMNDVNTLHGNSLGLVPTNWTIAGTGDFNGDGRSDLLWRNDAGVVAIWDMNDGTIIGGGSLGSVPLTWHIAGTGDFNGDHKSDIVWQNDAGLVSIWDMNDTVNIGGGSPGSVPANWHIAGTGDFNGDGKSDLLWRNDAGVTAIWDMNDAAVIGSGALGSIPTNWHIAGTGDFNGDHKSDILWRNDAGLVAIWDMNDTTVIGGGAVASLPSNWHISSTGDYNSDGMSDILLRNDAGFAAIWDMNDTTVIGGGSLGVVPSNWHIVA